MPNLGRFSDFARKVGVVAPVAPAQNSGDTHESVKYPKTTQALSQSVAPLAPVASCRDNDWSEEDWQAAFEERAGILEFDEGLPRPVAERLAREQVFGPVTSR
jgi:hypothetical protein